MPLVELHFFCLQVIASAAVYGFHPVHRPKRDVVESLLLQAGNRPAHQSPVGVEIKHPPPVPTFAQNDDYISNYTADLALPKHLNVPCYRSACPPHESHKWLVSDHRP